MTTRESIINIADQFIRDKGYNAFSFNDISNSVGIKTASVHYYFATKSQLGVAVIREHFERMNILKEKLKTKTPTEKIKAFLSIYSKIKSEDKVCIVGSLATDFNTIDTSIQLELKKFADVILNWVTEILEEGKQLGEFEFSTSARTKALIIITNMTAIVQLCRLTNSSDFETVCETIMNELKPGK